MLGSPRHHPAPVRRLPLRTAGPLHGRGLLADRLRGAAPSPPSSSARARHRPTSRPAGASWPPRSRAARARSPSRRRPTGPATGRSRPTARSAAFGSAHELRLPQRVAQRADRGHGLDARRQGLLAGRHRRRHLQLRRCRLLRVDRLAAPEQAHRRHRHDAERQGLLDGGRRRRHLQLRQRGLLRVDGRQVPQQADRRASPPTRRPAATGRWPPTAASSASTPRSSAAPAAST